MLGRRIKALLCSLMAVWMMVGMSPSSAYALTTGSLRASIVDDEMELPIPNVSITLSSEVLIGGEQERLSDVNGNTLFAELPPGAYTLVVQKAGFQSVTVVGIKINVNRTSVQTVKLGITGASTEIVVQGKRPAVDVEDTTRGQVLSKEFLQRIPAGRSYQSAVSMASGVLGGGNPNIAGGAYNENTYMLDGANITDPVTGTFSVNFNFDAIEQIEVLLGGYMPEYGVSLGGIVNLITESGTNNLEFDTSVFYTNGDWRPRMDARYTVDGQELAPTGFDSTLQMLTVASKISGPIVRDRAWFVISYQHSRSIIANSGIPQTRDYDAHYVLAKLTVQPNSEHRFTAFIQLDPTTIDNTDQGDPRQKPESQGRQAQGGYVVQGRWNWFISPEINLDTHVVVQKTYIEVNAVPCTHDQDLGYHPCKPWEPEGDLDWETPGRLGTYGAYDSVNFIQYYFDDRFRYAASSKLSLLSLQDPLGGSHDVKIGIGGTQLVWDQIQGLNGNSYIVDLYAAAYDPSTFENYYWWESTGPIKFRSTGSEWNFFIQDSWKPVKNLTIKYGTRFDYAVMRNDLGEPVLQGALWGPRLYASWDPFGDQKTKFVTGWGRFNDTGRLGVADYTSASNYGWKLYYGEYFDNGEGEGFLNHQSLMADLDPRANLNVSHDNLENPRVDEFILMVEREIVEDVAVFSNMSGKLTRFLYEPDQLNLIYDSDGSAIIGSRYGDSTLSRGRLRTPNLARRDYLQWDTGIRKIESHRWGGQITYTYTQSIGSSSNALSGSFMNDPQTQFNYGPFMRTDVQHVVKGYGYWDLPTDPWKQMLGMFFEYYSGWPYERNYYSEASMGYSQRIEPRGIYSRFSPYWSLSLRFSQEFDVRKGKLILDIEAQNITNNRAAEDIYSSPIDTENRLLIYSRQDPLRIQLGLKYQF